MTQINIQDCIGSTLTVIFDCIGCIGRTYNNISVNTRMISNTELILLLDGMDIIIKWYCINLILNKNMNILLVRYQSFIFTLFDENNFGIIIAIITIMLLLKYSLIFYEKNVLINMISIVNWKSENYPNWYWIVRLNLIELFYIDRISLRVLNNGIVRSELIPIRWLSLNCTNLEIDRIGVILKSIRKLSMLNSYVKFGSRRKFKSIVCVLIITKSKVPITKIRKCKQLFEQHAN